MDATNDLIAWSRDALSSRSSTVLNRRRTSRIRRWGRALRAFDSGAQRWHDYGLMITDKLDGKTNDTEIRASRSRA